MSRFGTLTLAQTMLVTDASSTVDELGPVDLNMALQNTLAAHNRQVAQMGAGLWTSTPKKGGRYGGNDSTIMERGDEQAMPRSQRISVGSSYNLPMDLFLRGLQWTELYFRKATLEEFNRQVIAILDSDARTTILEAKKALYRAANYVSSDHLDDGTDLNIKRLLNGDGAEIPNDPDGNPFNPNTHTHYLARAAGLAFSDFQAGITTVTEHFPDATIQIWINRLDEPTIRAVAGFIPYQDSRVILPTDQLAARARFNPQNYTNNQAIGLMGRAEVWIKPTAIQNYPLIINVTGPPPLARRYDPKIGDALELIYAHRGYPLEANAFRRVQGFGVQTRHVAAVLFIGGTSYVNPTFPAAA